jgi:hypothetical protein
VHLSGPLLHYVTYLVGQNACARLRNDIKVFGTTVSCCTVKGLVPCNTIFASFGHDLEASAIQCWDAHNLAQGIIDAHSGGGLNAYAKLVGTKFDRPHLACCTTSLQCHFRRP